VRRLAARADLGVGVLTEKSVLVATAHRGGEVLHMLWSAIDLDAGLWIKAFQFRKRKPTDSRQDPHLVPLAPMAVGILRSLKDYHERELARKNAESGGTWNGKKYGGWPLA
jgi:hypothetical protein